MFNDMKRGPLLSLLHINNVSLHYICNFIVFLQKSGLCYMYKLNYIFVIFCCVIYTKSLQILCLCDKAKVPRRGQYFNGDVNSTEFWSYPPYFARTRVDSFAYSNHL